MAKNPKAPKAKMPTAPSPEGKVLIGKGTKGDFVRQTQEMGTTQGFKHVSKHWLDTGTYSYDAVIAKLEEGRATIQDFLVPFKAMTPTVNDKGQFVMQHEGVDFHPTRYAMRHIAGHAGVSLFDVEALGGFRPDSAKRDRNRRQDREALLSLLNSGFSLLDPKQKYLFRTQTDGTLRAWLSDKYKIMDNVWFLRILQNIIPDGRFSHWKEDGDFSTLWGNILLPDSIRKEADSDYGAMFSIGNSEIGRRRLHSTPSLFRAICMNGCIWDQTKGTTFRKIHRGEINENVLMTIALELRTNLISQIPLFDQGIDQFLATREIGWDGASAHPVFAALREWSRVSKEVNTSILECWRDECNEEDGFHNDENLRRSAFAVINAVTRSAAKETSPKKWVERDEMGGKLLAWKPSEWKSLFHRAKSMTKEEVANSFVMSVN